MRAEKVNNSGIWKIYDDNNTELITTSIEMLNQTIQMYQKQIDSLTIEKNKLSMYLSAIQSS